MTLNQTLAAKGLTTSPAGNYKKHIIQGGEIIFTGNAGEVWEWLESLENSC